MDTQNFNNLKPLTLAIKKYLITPKRNWWTLGLLKCRVKNYKEIQKILNSLESYESESTSTFKYTVSLLYSCDVFKKTKAIRESLLEFISNYVVKNNYDREDIARFLYIYAPRYHKPWWTAWSIKVPALIAHEEMVLHKFRNRYQNSLPSTSNTLKANNTNNNSKNNSANIQNKNLTDSKILKIADDISNLSQTIYTELPKIDQKIKFEIKRISDDLQGLAKLIDMLDSEVPFNVQNIKKEITDILVSFNNVIIESSSILEKKLSIKPIEISDNISQENKNDCKTHNNTIEHTEKKIKTIIDDDIKWEQENKIDSPDTNENIILTKKNEKKSYVNKELTKQLHTNKLFRHKNIKTERTKNNNNHSYINAILSTNTINREKNKHNSQENNVVALNLPNVTNTINVTQKNKSDPTNNTKNIYTINFSDPNKINNQIVVCLNPHDQTLSLNQQVFKIDNAKGINDLNNYLDSKRDEMQALSLSDIIMKFMYDTSLDLEQLESYGLKVS